jgi:hypothetical protein
MRTGVPVVAFGEVPVKRRNDGVLRLGSSICRAHCPMQGPQALASTTPPISSNVPSRPSRSAGEPHQFRTGRYGELGLYLSAFARCLGGNRRRAGHVFIAGVVCRNQSGPLPASRPVVVANGLAKFDSGQARSGVNGPLICRLQFGEINFNQLVIVRGLGQHTRHRPNAGAPSPHRQHRQLRPGW